jgi:ferrous iron transport protein B
MASIFAIVLWLTIEGSNVPSAMLAELLVDTLHPWLKAHARALGMWPWLAGLLIDGMYLSGAWVVSVMLPPMAIFFPLFTLLEDFGYLPRVAFNLDRLFQKAGAHGKQALTMTMGLGCNAAGVVATRIIDSNPHGHRLPRRRGPSGARWRGCRGIRFLRRGARFSFRLRELLAPLAHGAER